MECPLCNADNDLTAHNCRVCGEDLNESKESIPQEPQVTQRKKVNIESVDITKKKFSKKRLSLALAALILLSLPWLFMADLMSRPWETVLSRKNFASSIKVYSPNAQKWDNQKNSILDQMKNQRLSKEIGKQQLEYNYLPSEILLSFIHTDLGFGRGELKNSSLFLDPEDHTLSTVILSKFEESTWPLNILLTLKIKLNNTNGETSISFEEFKRGKRKVSTDLAWEYFMPELQSLRLLESYSGGVHKFQITKSRIQQAGLKSSGQFQLTWNYSHPNFFPERLPVN
jgi:hypothetical protein